MSPLPLKSHKTFDGVTQFWEHDSTSTRTKMKFSTFIPDASRGPLKGSLIWLSGLTCTEENFMVKAGAQRHLSDHRMMVICPDTSPRGLNLPEEHTSWDFGSGAGFYVDATTPGYADHYRMFQYVVQELHSLIGRQFQVPLDRISIAGHSMGGHGALVMGLRHPEKFRSVSAFSPIANPTQAPWGLRALSGYLGSESRAWAAYDATELIKSGKRHPRPLLIDQGTKDEFLTTQLRPEALAEACRKSGQPVQLSMRDGYDHSYYFISSFIESHVQFHADALGDL